MCGSEQGHAQDPKNLATFGPGDAYRYAGEMMKRRNTDVCILIKRRQIPNE